MQEAVTAGGFGMVLGSAGARRVLSQGKPCPVLSVSCSSPWTSSPPCQQLPVPPSPRAVGSRTGMPLSVPGQGWHGLQRGEEHRDVPCALSTLSGSIGCQSSGGSGTARGQSQGPQCPHRNLELLEVTFPSSHICRTEE